MGFFVSVGAGYRVCAEKHRRPTVGSARDGQEAGAVVRRTIRRRAFPQPDVVLALAELDHFEGMIAVDFEIVELTVFQSYYSSSVVSGLGFGAVHGQDLDIYH